MTAELLSVRGLQVQFRSRHGLVHAVDGIDLDIRPGETVGLVGESGSGKTVTGRALLRLLAAPPAVYAGGSAMFRQRTADGRSAACVDLLSLPDREMRRLRGNAISMVFQDPSKALNPTMTVRQQVAEVFTQHRADELLADSATQGSRILGRAARGTVGTLGRQVLRLPPWRAPGRHLAAEIDERVIEALAGTRIPNPRQVMHRYPHELSGGMKQRVMIAQALACEPDLLIADEPTTALDVTIQARILDLFAELQERHGTAVLYISHDLTIVRRITDRVLVMYAGKVMETAPTEQLFSDPGHPYTRGLLAAVPSPGQRRGELVAIEGSVPELVEPVPSCRFASRCPHATQPCFEQQPPPVARSVGHEVACVLAAPAEAVALQQP